MKEIGTNVLVIGSGAAGLRTAIELDELGTDCIVVGKCTMGDAHTTLATGGINAALGNMDPKDHWLLHAADTFREGQYIADHLVVEKLCREAPRAIKDLESYGMKFHREANGKITQRFFGAALYRRACFSGDETGKEIIRCMVAETKKRRIKFMEDVYVTKLLKSRNRVSGAFGVDVKEGDFIVLVAKAVVLATGGFSRIYRRSSSRTFENTGDGVTLAYEAGAELQDMEMTQFHPTGMIWPPEAEGILVTEAVRGEGGFLYNSKHERFMKKYDKKRMELGPRDEVARAVYSEIEAGRGTEHGGVWLDVRHLKKEYILERLPKMYRQFHDFLHLDISKDLMEVAPTSHYSMGGIKVDWRTMQTCVPGLFAVGEVTGGLHGANRLGGNSLLECIVFGNHAAGAASRAAEKAGREEMDNAEIDREAERIKSLIGKSGPGVSLLRKRIQENMWEHAGIIRDERRMKRGLYELEQIRTLVADQKAYSIKSSEFPALLDVRNMLIPCEAVMRTALLRKESRGAHARSDYKSKSSRYLGSFVCRKSGRGMEISFQKTQKPDGPILKALKTVEKAKYHHLE